MLIILSAKVQKEGRKSFTEFITHLFICFVHELVYKSACLFPLENTVRDVKVGSICTYIIDNNYLKHSYSISQ